LSLLLRLIRIDDIPAGTLEFLDVARPEGCAGGVAELEGEGDEWDEGEELGCCAEAGLSLSPLLAMHVGRKQGGVYQT
jgi:hypothetical protein